MNEKPHTAAIEVNGAWYLSDAKASLVPIGMVKAEDLLMDELVRSVVGKATADSAAATAAAVKTSNEMAQDANDMLARLVAAAENNSGSGDTKNFIGTVRSFA